MRVAGCTANIFKAIAGICQLRTPWLPMPAWHPPLTVPPHQHPAFIE
jgi:hypothetical protein